MSKRSRTQLKRRSYLGIAGGTLLALLLLSLLFSKRSIEAGESERSRIASPPGAWAEIVPLPLPGQTPAIGEPGLAHYAAGARAYQKQDYGKASVGFRKATEALPDNPELRVYLGSSLIMTQDYDIAERELRVASQLAKDDLRDKARLLLAKAQLDRGDLATARETLAAVAVSDGVWSAKAKSLLNEITFQP